MAILSPFGSQPFATTLRVSTKTSNRFVFSYRNYVDSATFSEGATASEWLSALPLGNLKTPLLSEKARTDSDDEVDFDVDLGANKTISMIALLAHNLSSTAQWRIQISQKADLSTTVYDSDWQSAETQDTFGFIDTVFGRYIRINLSDVGNSDGYLQAGRLIVDAPWRPANNIQYEWRLRRVSRSTKRRSRGGQPWVDRLQDYDRLAFEVLAGDEDDMWSQAYEADRRLAQGGDCLVMVNPTNSSYRKEQSIYGSLRSQSSIIEETRGLWRKVFEIESAMGR